MSQGHVVVTHDSDSGTLVAKNHSLVIGIVYLRPGHVDIQFTIESIQALMSQTSELPARFVIVVKRTGDDVTIRLRDLSP